MKNKSNGGLLCAYIMMLRERIWYVTVALAGALLCANSSVYYPFLQITMSAVREWAASQNSKVLEVVFLTSTACLFSLIISTYANF